MPHTPHPIPLPVPPAPAARPVVFVVDPDDAVRDALAAALEATGLAVAPFRCASEFLGVCGPGPSGCLLVEVDLPGITGLELLRVLAGSGRAMPTIVMTSRLRSRELGARLPEDAVGLLEKPFGDERLLALVCQALARLPAAAEAPAARA